MTEGNQRDALPSGWLLLLCLLLILWHPISFALLASTMLVRLAARGVPLALILLARVVILGCGIAAGLLLLRRRRAGVGLAKITLALTAIVDVVVYSTPYFPLNLPPGDAPLYAAASVVYSAVWIIYLFRSKRIRRLLSQG